MATYTEELQQIRLELARLRLNQSLNLLYLVVVTGGLVVLAWGRIL